MLSLHTEHKTVVIVGGAGFIGSALAEALLAKEYTVVIIDRVQSRIVHERLTSVTIDLASQTLDPQMVNGCYGIINLAGASIAGKRWTKGYKTQIYDSRIRTTQAIVQAMSECSLKPKVLVSASASGYYGDQGTTILTEEHGAGTDFLAKVCVDWEREAVQAENYGVRTVLIRTANVLGPGGLLASLRPLFKKGLGGYFGSGHQYMPWVHWSDIVGIYIYALEHEIVQGPFNVGAGTTLSQKDLFTAYARSIGVSIVWRIPRIVARLVLGEFSDALLDSQNTSSQKIRDAGYVYKIHTLEEALKNML